MNGRAAVKVPRAQLEGGDVRVVVTGGAGFVGAHLAHALAARGDEVVALDVTSEAPLLASRGMAVERCDVGFWSELLEALRGARPEVVFHTAGILSAGAEERPRAAYRVNAVGTFNVLEAASLLEIPRVVFTSTIATYGGDAPSVVDERTQQRPESIYGVTKVFNELLGEYYARRLGVDFRGVRLPAVIGPGRGGGGASAYSSLVVSEPALGRPYAVPVRESARMPIVYVKDAVEALIRISDVDPDALARRRTYLVGGFSATAAELVDAVRAALPGAAVEFRPDPDTARLVDSWPDEVDDREARADWGWRSRFGLRETVEDFVAELRHERPSVAAKPGRP
jgi:threonine 3-dehydrogenase